MRKILVILAVLLSANFLNAQTENDQTYLPKFALKTNALYWATTTPNLGIEIGLSRKFTLDISGNYNPWKFSDNERIKHWLVQPELRYWFCERFNGHYLGLHGHYAEYNVGGIKMLDLDGKYYQGNLYGGGISYGYHWILNDRWSLEASVGVGYAHLDYDKYPCAKCGPKIKSDTKNYWGPTKAAISFIYVIK